MNNPEVTGQALSILRSGENFHWSFITLFVLVVYVYYNEIEKKNWNAIAAGLTLYMIHWFVEIVNALIQHFSGQDGSFAIQSLRAPLLRSVESKQYGNGQSTIGLPWHWEPDGKDNPIVSKREEFLPPC